MRRHPFNVEPPLGTLVQKGFITPASLHYIRNHGAVPQIAWAQHRLSICGLVDRPTVFTMDELIARFEHVDVTCTLTCAGNRRKVRHCRPQALWPACCHLVKLGRGWVAAACSNGAPRARKKHC
jgi:nitrate reductase (NAD(P)H)